VQEVGGGESCVAVSLAKLQLKKFVTAVHVQSDSSLTVNVSLGSCDLDDTRPCCHTGITRYVSYINITELAR